MNPHVKKSLKNWTEKLAQSQIEKIQTLEETLTVTKTKKKKKQVQKAIDRSCDIAEKLISVVINDSISGYIH